MVGLQAQKQATTTEGEKVWLFSDGSWSYAINDSVPERKPIRENPNPLKYSVEATELTSSQMIPMGLMMKPGEWDHEIAMEGEYGEFVFTNHNDALFALMINEAIPSTLENMREVVLSNARAVAPDMKVTDEEYRTVNGLRVLMIQMTGTLEGTRYQYYNYYYTDEEGSTQLLTYTSAKAFSLYKTEMEKLLNGLVKTRTE
jgi:hypothetical protein